MAANNSVQLVIDLILKNKAELEGLLAQLKTQYGIDVDTSGLDAAAEALAEMSDGDAVIDADASGAVDAAEEATEAVESVPDEHNTDITADAGNTLRVAADISLVYQGLADVYGKVSGAVADLLKTYSAQEESDRKLLSAIKAKTTAHAEYFEFLAQEADRIQQITLIGDEETQKLMSAAMNMGIAMNQVSSATKGAIGLAEKYAEVGLTQQTAMKGIALAYKGEFTQLSRYIPELRTAADDAEKMEILQRSMAEGFDMASAAIETQTGKYVQLQNKYGDLKEIIGEWFANLAVMNAEVLGIDLEEGLKIKQTRDNFAHMAGDIDAMKEAYKEYALEGIELQNSLNDTLAKDGIKGWEAQLARIKETELARKILEEMADEWERSQQAAADAADAAENYEDSVKHLSEPISGLSDEVDAALGDDNTDGQDMLDKLFWADEDLEAKTQALTEAIVGSEEENLAIINAFNQKTKQLNGDHYAASMMQIDEYYRQKHDALRDAGISEEEITEQTEAAKDAIRKQYERRALGGASTMFSNMATVAKAGGKAGFNAWKRFSQAQALIDTYKSANSAYAAMAGIPIVGPALGTIAAAAAIAAGLVNVRTIEKQKFSSGGISSGPESGYDVELHGTEAVVPLPDGKSIPVQMSGPASSAGNDSALLKQILGALQALNANIVSGMNVTIHIHTSDRDLEVEVDNMDNARASMVRRGYEGS
jgi:hypothetical protein